MSMFSLQFACLESFFFSESSTVYLLFYNKHTLLTVYDKIYWYFDENGTGMLFGLFVFAL